MSVGARQASARIAAKNAVKIRAALAGSIDARRIYTQYLDTNPPITADRVADRIRARAWAMKNVKMNLDIYKKVLRKHYADMYVLGQSDSLEAMAQAAKAQKGPVATASSKPKLNPQGLPEFDPSFSINWDNWEPGNEAAAALLSRPGGLKQLLNDIEIQAAGIEDYGYNLLGTALADGIAAGDTPVQIANSIRDSLSSPERALTIAITEGQRAKISANVDSYAANGVEQIQWTVNDPDDADCLDNDGEIVNLGDEFKSGDTQPPVHPNCQCDVIPVMPDLSGTPEYSDNTDNTEMAVEANLAKYSPDQERDSHGRFESGNEMTGGSGLSRAESVRLNVSSDPLQSKVYKSEFAVRDGQQTIRGTLEKPVAPVYPKEAIEQTKIDGNLAERMRLIGKYQDEYKAYSSAFNKYQNDVKVVSLQSNLAKETLDGTKAGVAKYIEKVTNQDWFKQAYGTGEQFGKLNVAVRAVKTYAGRYTSGLTKNEISISNSYTQNEPTIIHEIAHYAQQISATSQFQGHGVGFAETNIHLTENIMGKAAADRLVKSYMDNKVPVYDR